MFCPLNGFVFPPASLDLPPPSVLWGFSFFRNVIVWRFEIILQRLCMFRCVCVCIPVSPPPRCIWGRAHTPLTEVCLSRSVGVGSSGCLSGEAAGALWVAAEDFKGSAVGQWQLREGGASETAHWWGSVRSGPEHPGQGEWRNTSGSSPSPRLIRDLDSNCRWRRRRRPTWTSCTSRRAPVLLRSTTGESEVSPNAARRSSECPESAEIHDPDQISGFSLILVTKWQLKSILVFTFFFIN